MAMTHKQRNFLLGCVAVFVVYYVGGSILETMHRAAYLHRMQAIRAAQMQKAKEQADAKAKAAAAHAAAAPPAPAPSAPAAKAIPAPVSPLTTVSNLSGIWAGRGALPGRGVCTLRLELRDIHDAQGQYSGYSTLVCQYVAPLIATKNKHDQARAIINKMDPEAAVLTGTPDNSSVHFKVDTTIGADADGCTATSFTVVPFGTNRIAAHWQEGSCQGGEILLARAGK